MADEAPIRVLIADDQDVVRIGLRVILEANGFEVVADVADGRSAVDEARRLLPDVCLLDIRMPRLDGLEATRLLAGPDAHPPMRVVIVTTFDDDDHVRTALRNGACGFILKDAGPGLLVEAVRAAARGDALISPSVTVRLLERLADTEPAAPVRPPVEPLSDREEEVLRLVAVGRSNQQIADELFISLSTVKTHVHSLATKLAAENRVELAAWAWETGRMRRRA